MSDAAAGPGYRRYEPPALDRLEERSSDPAAEPCLQPRVLLQREDGRVKRIDIVCPCGNTIQVDCEYEDAS